MKINKDTILMKNKNKYIRPEVEIITIEGESIIASSLRIQEEEVTGTTRAKKFWENIDEGL